MPPHTPNWSGAGHQSTRPLPARLMPPHTPNWSDAGHQSILQPARLMSPRTSNWSGAGHRITQLRLASTGLNR
eukprot:365345-Chlamydomonas_euryale.AAC.1